MDPVALLRNASVLTSRNDVRRLVPVAAMVLLIAGLLEAGAPSDPPSWAVLRVVIEELSAVDLVVLTLAIVAVSLFLQPLLRSINGLLQGLPPRYWPWLGARMRARRAERVRVLEQNMQKLERQRLAASREGQELDPEILSDLQRTDTALHRLPPSNAVSTTQLGDVLDGAEYDVMSRYGLEVHVVLPRLKESMPKEARDSLSGVQDDLDFATDLTSASALATLISAVLVVPGLASSVTFALLLPVVVAVLTALAYRRAVAAGAEYAEVLRVTFDLHRHDLYRALGLAIPATAEDERIIGRRLTSYLWRGSPPLDELAIRDQAETGR